MFGIRGKRGISGRSARVGKVGVEKRGMLNEGRRGSSGRTKYRPGDAVLLDGLPPDRGDAGTAS